MVGEERDLVMVEMMLSGNGKSIVLLKIMSYMVEVKKKRFSEE